MISRSVLQHLTQMFQQYQKYFFDTYKNVLCKSQTRNFRNIVKTGKIDKF